MVSEPIWMLVLNIGQRRGVDSIILKDQSIDLSDCKLIGKHNRYNIAVAALVAKEFGVSSEVINSAVNSFSTLEHRMEFVESDLDRLVINDTKSTTVAASVAAIDAVLEKYSDKKISIMIGGLAKAGSWGPVLRELAKSKDRINPVICFGDDGRMLSKLCKDSNIPCLVAPKVEDALKEALETSKSGDVLLFSPGCASFDEFGDFEERGNMLNRMCRGIQRVRHKL